MYGLFGLVCRRLPELKVPNLHFSLMCSISSSEVPKPLEAAQGQQSSKVLVHQQSGPSNVFFPCLVPVQWKKPIGMYPSMISKKEHLVLCQEHASSFTNIHCRVRGLSYLEFTSQLLQRTKVNGAYSTQEELLKDVPQGLVLGPLLFNNYLNDMFYIN